jgi:signal transduction histidine kinase
MTAPLSILLVEDNPADVFLMQEMLKDGGVNHLFKLLEDGEEAIEYLLDSASGSDIPNLVILDLNMPKRNGHEVLAAIRDCPKLSRVPVVVLTTSDNPDDKSRVLEKGAAYLTKPAKLDNFVSLLETVEVAASDIAVQREAEVKQYWRGLFEAEMANILLIEDNQADSFLVAELLKELKQFSYDFRAVEDLESALTVLATEPITLVLTDLGLPDKQGLDVLTELLAASSTVPIIILTGLDDEDTAVAALTKGAQDYLVKGQFDSRALGRAIRYAVTRKKAEEFALEAVSYENLLLQEVLEHSPIGIARYGKDLKVTTCNSVFASLIGVKEVNIFGTAIGDLISLPDSSLWLTTITQSAPFRVEQCRHVRPGVNGELYLDLTVWPIASRDADSKGGIVLAIDISNRIKLEKHRDDFHAALAHDIRNPLLGADRVLSFLTNPQLSIDEHDEMVAVLKQSNNNVLTMLQNLLDIHRYETAAISLDFEAIALINPIKAAISSTARTARDKNITIDLRVPDWLPKICADFAAMQRLFSNLLDNAIRFTEAGGTVVVNAFAREEDKSVIVEVIDTGPGMSEDELSVVFNRFGESQASKYRGGTGSGLGLYLCKQIVDFNNASISCTSKPDAGTKFIVRFAQYDANARQRQ